MIHNKFFTAIVCLVLSLSINACAQGKKSTSASKSADKHAKLIAAAKQLHLPGAPGMEPTTSYMFVIVWKSTTPPETFFWRGEDGWMPCHVNKASRTNAENKSFPYDRAFVQLDKVKQGDTLMLIPATRSKDVMPQNIPTTSKNTVFFKTVKTNWLSLAVTNIKELPKEIGQ
jgi:hypothetical protein